MSRPLVEMRGIQKRFGGVRAVDGADLALRAGEVLGLLGHNGAGKSTLLQGLSGALPVDAGEILLEGRAVRIRSPRDARALGIETLYQDLALAENLDATANLFLGRELTTRLGLLDEEAMERAARDVVRRLEPAFERFGVPVRSLSGGERQLVAIARAVLFRARVLILDEPTAALGPAEARAVGELVRRLRDEGLALLVVSHDLHDVFELADRVAVMQRGRVVAERLRSETTREEVLALVVGGGPGAPPVGPGETTGSTQG
jgi:D-xylose transport system ATP-binding protein